MARRTYPSEQQMVLETLMTVEVAVAAAAVVAPEAIAVAVVLHVQ